MRILICGGGVIGASIAWFLAKRGAKPVVIERTGVANAASVPVQLIRKVLLRHRSDRGRRAWKPRQVFDDGAKVYIATFASPPSGRSSASLPMRCRPMAPRSSARHRLSKRAAGD
jgi:2-polyprenyl-6-methoxyphenol hydroxylase-like FAD-dependent oxidoreductase